MKYGSLFENDVITPEQELIVRKYVNQKYFDVETFIDFLNQYEIITFDIFKNSQKKRKGIDYGFLSSFRAIKRDIFIRRIPIYFYDINLEDYDLEISSLFNDYARIHNKDDVDYGKMAENDEFDLTLAHVSFYNRFLNFDTDFEPLYKRIEFFMYSMKIDISDMLEYIYEQSGQVSLDIFDKWFDYLNLDTKNSVIDTFPKNLLYSYNVALINNNRQPIYYFPNNYHILNRREKNKTCVKITGQFPIDNNGDLVIEWIRLWTENVDKIYVDPKKYAENNETNVAYKYWPFRDGKLTNSIIIEVNPDSRVFICENEKKDGLWEQIYCGPKLIKLDYTKLTSIREKLGYSIKDVSDNTDINIRTIQRIESGESMPDGQNLIKIMCFLGIREYTNLIKKEIIEDPSYEKFNSKNTPSFWLNN